MSILVSGSLAYDYIMNFPDSFKNHIMPDQLHILNVSFMVEKLARTCGGTAGNIAYTLKLLGAEPFVVSAVGTDGHDYIAEFEHHGICTDFIVRDERKLTASGYITTDCDDNQIAAFYPGPLTRGGEIHARSVTPRPAVALISPTPKEVMIQHMKECSELEIPAVFDPGQQIIAFNEAELKRMVSQAQFVIGNDYEIQLLQERTGWSGKDILANCPVLIATFGERGSVVTTRDGLTIEIKPCIPLSCDDPTGAGDAYRAGFFAGHAKGLDFKTCGQIGSVAASYAIETVGTQEHHFTTEEFKERYQKTYGEAVEL